MKKERLAKILQIIDEIEIKSQDELQFQLKKYGYNITQATISRDIRDLRLRKIPINGGHKYEAPKFDVKRLYKINPIFSSSVTVVDFAGNTVAIKCGAGMAQAACAAFDTMNYPDIVGTLAGEDTIFILLRNEKEASELANLLKNFLLK